MKKIRTIIAALLLSCSATIANAHDFEVNGICYNILSGNSNNVEVTCKGASYDSYENEYSGVVTLPSTVTYNGQNYTVAAIGAMAFAECTGLEGIEVPSSVATVGKYAFYGCTALESVTLPSSITEINECAFYKCTGLAAVHITDLLAWCRITFDDRESNPLFFAKRLFINGEMLTDLVIPAGITEIKDFTFNGYSNLRSITIPDGVVTIGSRVFNDCTAVETLTIPPSVTSIGEFAFSGCSGITLIDIPEGVTSIGMGAFNGCAGITEITIPNGVTTINDYLFYYCI